MGETEWIQVKIRVSEDVLTAIDQIADDLGVSRQQVILTFIDNSLEEVLMLKRIGASPRRIRKVIHSLQRLGFLPKDVAIPGDEAEGAES